jgi:hypothetical protein
MHMLEWLFFSLILFCVWLLIYSARPALRKEMLWASLVTAPLALLEPIYVPAYWTPPSLFNLAQNTGFDLESFIFCFAVGGIAAVIREAVLGLRHIKLSEAERRGSKNAFHTLSILLPAIVYAVLVLFTRMNPIYSIALSMLAGGAASLATRPDLAQNMLWGAMMFTGFYFAFFLFVNAADPMFINSWNFREISGILVAGVPLEELITAFCFGLMWSSVYEHTMWYGIRPALH